MDAKLTRQLIEAAKQMEEILWRNGIERSDLHWSERIAAAERALAEEEEAALSFVAGMESGMKDAANALRLADKLAGDILIWHNGKIVGECHCFHCGNAREYRKARGLEKGEPDG